MDETVSMSVNIHFDLYKDKGIALDTTKIPLSEEVKHVQLEV